MSEILIGTLWIEACQSNEFKNKAWAAQNTMQHVQAIPAPVLALRNLRRLVLSQNRLQALPLGPWLQNLEIVDFSYNRFTMQPAELLSLLPNLKNVEQADKIAEHATIRSTHALDSSSGQPGSERAAIREP